MSKIIFSLATLGQGGAERVASNLSFPLCDAFDTVIILLWNEHPIFYDYDKRVKVLCVEKEVATRNDVRRMVWFRNFVKDEKPDLILSFLEPYNLRVLLSTIGLGVKVIVSERNDPHSVNKYWIVDQFEKLLYRRADKIIVQTSTIKNFFNGHLEEKTQIIYNPVNLEKQMIRKAIDTQKKKRIVSVARLTPQKNLDILLKAFAAFCTIHSGYTLTIYGEGPCLKELEELAFSLNISDSVCFAGAVKELHNELLDAVLMCLVSSREGMSNAMIESMCLGLPCICTKVSGAVDLISDGVNGFLVDVGDILGLASKMCYIVEHPKEAYEIGARASDLYTVLNKEKIYEEWINTLKDYVMSNS